MSEVLERRLEFLKLEAKGFSLCEIVKLLSEKYQTSERNIYYDAETRDTWQPVLTQLFDLDKARLILINRYDFLYRRQAFIFKLQTKPRNPFTFPKWWTSQIAWYHAGFRNVEGKTGCTEKSCRGRERIG